MERPTHSSILPLKVSLIAEPDRLESMGQSGSKELDTAERTHTHI